MQSQNFFFLPTVDCWDGDDGEPIIYHGWTLTSKILFKDVLKAAILKYAFSASDYPLILSIENHCSVPYQDKMAKYLVEILGSMLCKDEIDENRETLPSPEDLKFKILIKAKKRRAGEQGTYTIIVFISCEGLTICVSYFAFFFLKIVEDEEDGKDDEDEDDDDLDEKRKQKPEVRFEDLFLVRSICR